MKYSIISILFCIITYTSFSQIELNVIKIKEDSFKIYFTKKPDLQMNKSYDFIIKTNIKKEDSLLLNLCINEGYLENNLKFKHTFYHHIYPLSIQKKTSAVSKPFFAISCIEDIKGVKYILKIDGKQYYRHIGGSFGPNSIFTIDFISDIYNLKDIEIRDPVYFSIWFKKKKVDSLFLKNYHLSFKLKDINKLKQLKQKKMLFIVFPQVYYKGIPLLSKKDSERVAIVYFDENL